MMFRPGRIIMLNDFCRARGGATSIALLATRLLRQRGHEVVFVTGDDGKNPMLEEIGVRTVALDSKPLLQASKYEVLRRGWWNEEGAVFLAAWIAAEGRPDDVWHLHNWSQIWSPSIFRGLKAVGDRLVVHAHDYFNACPNGAFWNYPKGERCELKPLSAACLTSGCDRRNRVQKLWRVVRHAMLGDVFQRKDAPRLLLIHPGMEPSLLRAGFHGERMETLRNPVTPFLPEPVDAGANRGFVFVGRLDAEKGALQLAQAAALAGVPVTFIGEGPQQDAVAAACPHARMTGWLDHAGIRNHAARARALVMPSRYPEPFGLVAVEALGSGIPVVASHTALLAGEIDAAGVGWSVDCSDLDAFALCLRNIHGMDDADVSAMSRKAAAAAGMMGLTPGDWCDGLEAAYARSDPGSDPHERSDHGSAA
jgi:glycosyltransferase involved in cell wall biosynthesis